MANNCKVKNERLRTVNGGANQRNGRYRFCIKYADEKGASFHEYTDIFASLTRAEEVVDKRKEELQRQGFIDIVADRSL